MTISVGTCVVVSYYDRRPVEPLWRLFEAMSVIDAGREFRIAVVVNRTGAHSLSLPQSKRLLGVYERVNLGMNIGAWDSGWRHFSGFGTYVFLQDECYPVQPGWLDALASRAEEVDIGLVGESTNLAWDKPWPVLREKQASVSMPEHLIDGNPANRVDVYLDFFRRQGIEPGQTGRHIRSLVWAIRREVLEGINGFPVGANYGECIAAEIGTTKKIEGAGLRAEQVARHPFTFVRHLEWNQDSPGGSFVHSPPSPILHRVPDWATQPRSELPSWLTVLRLVARRLRRPFA